MTDKEQAVIDAARKACRSECCVTHELRHALAALDEPPTPPEGWRHVPDSNGVIRKRSAQKGEYCWKPDGNDPWLSTCDKGTFYSNWWVVERVEPTLEDEIQRICRAAVNELHDLPRCRRRP